MDKAPLSPRRVRDSTVEVTHLVMPNEANVYGTVFGGIVMQQIDIAASIAAMRHARRPVVTASIDSLDFRRPIRVGQAMILRAAVNWAGRTSMEVGVQVLSEDLMTGVRETTNAAYLTFVAVDERGRPSPVPPLQPETDEERRRFSEAVERRRQRLERLRREPG